MDKVLLIISIIVFPLLIWYGFKYVLNAPFKLPHSIVGKTMYVFSHEKNVAEVAYLEDLDPYKKSKRYKFFIPESCGRLEPGKTYDFLQDKNGDFIVKQVAVMLG